jgi:hypothetical protein
MNAAEQQMAIARSLSPYSRVDTSSKPFAVKCAMAAGKILREWPDISSTLQDSPFSACDMMVAYYNLTKCVSLNPTVRHKSGKTVLIASAIFEDSNHLKKCLMLAKGEVEKQGLDPNADDRDKSYLFGEIGDIIMDPNPRHQAIINAFCSYGQKLQEELGEGEISRLVFGGVEPVRRGCGCLVLIALPLLTYGLAFAAGIV